MYNFSSYNRNNFLLSILVTEKELQSIAKSVRPFAEQSMKIQVAPWLEGYNVTIDKLYTEFIFEKIENEPTGPSEKRLRDYKELFETHNQTQRSNETEKSKSEKDPGKKILFKGDPGMGKTTISRKITWDWAVGFFKIFVIVFLVYLKFFRPGDSIENVINKHPC